MSNSITGGQRASDTVAALVGRQLTIRFDWDRDWCGAVCPELEVSGFGTTPREAIESVARSIESTLKAMKANVSGEGRQPAPERHG